MSIIINLYYTGTGGNARKFAEEMEHSGTAALIRREAGNQQALDQHHASPMMEKIVRLREKYDLHMRAERFCTDEGGFPASDAKYIPLPDKGISSYQAKAKP